MPKAGVGILVIPLVLHGLNAASRQERPFPMTCPSAPVRPPSPWRAWSGLQELQPWLPKAVALLGVAGFGILGVRPLAAAPARIVIDAGSFRVRADGLHFQFQADPGDPGDFEVLGAGALGDTAWQAIPGTQIDGVEEGVFQASLPAPTAGTGFLRVRRSGLPPAGPAPLLNEVMSDNTATQPAEDGRYWDWIEIHNPHDEAVNLDGFALSDDPAQPGRWRFPEVIVAPGGHLVVWASGLDVAPPGGPFHTGFRLDAAGETVVLTDPAGREVDRVLLPPLRPDESLGRSPDGGGNWHVLARPNATPGRENPVVTSGQVIDPPVFTVSPGFHPGPVDLDLRSLRVEGVVHATTNGAVPTAFSPVWEGPRRVERTTVIRAVVIDREGRASREAVGTFLVNARHALPVVALAGDPGHFEFRNGYLYGMGSRVLGSGGQVLQNYPYPGSHAWQDREVGVHLEFFEPDGQTGLQQWVGLKIFGGWGSRGYPQKSLALFARRKYGDGRMRHAVFPGLDVDSFEALVLRNSGNDNQGSHQTPPRPPIDAFGPTTSHGSYFVNGTFTLLRDAMLQRLLDGTGLDTQAYRPAVVYLNGEYWGLYNLREKFNEHYVASHHGVEAGAIDLIEGYGSVRAGDAEVYRAMRDFVNTRSPAVEDHYREILDRYLELDNFIDYNLAVIYFQNFDIGNIKCWRPRVPRGRFRWMVFDQDYGFGLWPPEVYLPAMARDYADYANMFRFATAGTGTATTWPNGGGQTLLLRRMLAHRGFQERFIVRCADFLNSRFREDQVVGVIDALAGGIRPEMERHLERWSWVELQKRGFGAPHQPEHAPFTTETWEAHLEHLRDFARQRPTALRADCSDHFRLAGGWGTLAVRREPERSGVVRLNSLTLDPPSWRGLYPAAYPNTLVAVPLPGHRFEAWSTPEGVRTENPLAWHVTGGATNEVVARFAPLPAGTVPVAPLRITEINYHAPEDLDAGDWIEIHNPGPQPVRLAGWVLRDDDDDRFFVLPDEDLGPGGYRVFCRDRLRFQLAHPSASDPGGVLPFALGNEGDTVRLFDPQGVLAQATSYDDRAPWPEAADGGGSTLEWVRGDLDPGSPGAWAASAVRGGTPGR